MRSDLEATLRKPFYSPSEVAELASVSSSTVLHYIHSGRLAAVRLSDRVYRIPRRAVLRLLEPDSVPEIKRRDEPAADVDPFDADRDVGFFARS